MKALLTVHEQDEERRLQLGVPTIHEGWRDDRQVRRSATERRSQGHSGCPNCPTSAVRSLDSDLWCRKADQLRRTMTTMTWTKTAEINIQLDQVLDLFRFRAGQSCLRSFLQERTWLDDLLMGRISESADAERSDVEQDSRPSVAVSFYTEPRADVQGCRACVERKCNPTSSGSRTEIGYSRRARTCRSQR